MQTIIDQEEIEDILNHSFTSDKINQILEKVSRKKGLNLHETAALLSIEKADDLQKLFGVANQIKQEMYGNRLVLFAPLYISNYCINDCTYCGFRKSNHSIKRNFLSLDEIKEETRCLLARGHKRILLVMGEAWPAEGFNYLLKAIEAIYSVEVKGNRIRRININTAPLKVDEFKKLKKLGIGTYQLFQETYHRKTYKEVHPEGPKSNYDNRLQAIDDAFRGGIDDVGIGTLFGLYNYKFEILALMQHVHHLEKKFGVGPHTISVPRLEPAPGSSLASNPTWPVNDVEFKKIIAIVRLAIPYVGIILSTRENPDIRNEALNLGISQISAGSRTNPGGYSRKDAAVQFSLGDHRPMDEIIRQVVAGGFLPSFCTSCYRLGRTGENFMKVAKTGHIKEKCLPNALLTLAEYLLDYGSPATKIAGFAAIENNLEQLEPELKQFLEEKFTELKRGKRDVYL
ncbi:MAG: [FeFe] hydrogenase H-cluster radical SAM maturase HydG [Deltaproteobacteria bacterium]|jgi:2-iminoacetate synthase|nr:[FeFe] hydrogenase H-cluster radical SAM maturase HydG [Deltaproteobacteria bacterium]